MEPSATSYDWELYDINSYQMEAWGFPKTISSGSTAKIYVEWDQGILTTESDDQGKAFYKVNGKRLLIHANGKHGFNVRIVYIDYFSAYCNPDKDFNLGWDHNRNMLFMLSGNENCRYWDNVGTAKNMMYDSRSVIGGKMLKDICVVGSHDSGMSESTSQTVGALDCNTITQTKNIENQLNYGVRFFDIRPVISGGNFYTGHYSKVEPMGITTWQGGRGQSIEDIIDNLNSFLNKDRNEAVILNLSHAYNTDTGNSSYKSFTNSEWIHLVSVIEKGVNSLYRDKKHNPLDVTLNDLLFTPSKSSVIVIVPSAIANNNKLPPAFVSIDIYDKYSGTNDYNHMKEDQLQKMKRYSKNRYFLLSWTLTQDENQALTCGLPIVGGSSILELADKANNGLVDAVMNSIDKNSFPNIISLDDIINCNPALLAYGINMNT